MTIRLFSVAVLISLTACPGVSIPSNACGDEVCDETQRCDRNVLRCVLNEAPTLQLSGPGELVSSAMFQVTGTASDDEGVKSVEWRVEGGEWLTISTTSDGKFSFDVEASMLDSAPMRVSVRAGDGRLTTEQAIDVVVDRVAPEIEQPFSRVVTDSSTPMTVAVMVHDGSNGLSALTIGGIPVSTPKTDMLMTVEMPSPRGDLQNIEVVVTAKDLHGNEKTQTFQVTADTVGPEIRFVTPTATSPAVAAPGYRVEVEARDLSSVQRVRLAMNDGGQVDAAWQDGGTWAADFALPDVEQPVTFVAEAIDGVGNLSSLRSAPLQVDRVAPTVTVAGPAVDSIHREAFTVSANTNADAVSAGVSILGTVIPMSLGTDGVWRAQTPPLPAMRDYSAESFFIIVRDAVGNEARSAPRQVFVDTKPPLLAFTTPAANARLNISNFASGNNDVPVAWTIADADPMVVGEDANGTPTSALSLNVASSPSDNPRLYRVEIAARDRAGNRTQKTLEYTVDRVAPTVANWLPAAQARNVDPFTSITFSEPVQGPTPATDALAISPLSSSAVGTWNAPHDRWTSSQLPWATVFDATVLASLTDAHGNPIAMSSRRFHTTAAVPTSRILATNVRNFTAASDADGVLTFTVESGSQLSVLSLSPTTGAIIPTTVQSNSFTSGRFSLNASQQVDLVALTATHRVASTHYQVASFLDPITRMPRQSELCTQRAITNGAAEVIGTPHVVFQNSGPCVALSQAAYYGEQDASPFAVIESSQYQRGSAPAVTLSTAADLVVAQSESSWAAFSTSSTSVSWTRYMCGEQRLIGGGYKCHSYDFSAATSSPSELRATMNLGGRCLVATWMSGGVRQAVFQPLDDCFRSWPLGSPPPVGCSTNASVPVSVVTDLRVAPFSNGGVFGIIGARSTGGVMQLGMMRSGACADDFTPVGAPLPWPTAMQFEPIQVGNKPALMYIDTANNLQLYVP